MSSEKRNKLSEIFKLAWQFVKRNGYKLSEALKCAWLNMKLKAEMKKRIVKFYFQKIDGSLREAYGTTNPETIPATTGTRKPADTVQTYFDTYCEGKTNVPIPIDHAFNKVGNAYIDITFEFALHENPSIYEYVTFGEYDAKTIRKAVLETGYYGEIYKWLYYQSKK